MAASDGAFVAVGSERAGGSPASVHSSISMAVGGDVLLGEGLPEPDDAAVVMVLGSLPAAVAVARRRRMAYRGG